MNTAFIRTLIFEPFTGGLAGGALAASLQYGRQNHRSWISCGCVCPSMACGNNNERPKLTNTESRKPNLKKMRLSSAIVLLEKLKVGSNCVSLVFKLVIIQAILGPLYVS